MHLDLDLHHLIPGCNEDIILEPAAAAADVQAAPVVRRIRRHGLVVRPLLLKAGRRELVKLCAIPRVPLVDALGCLIPVYC